MSEYGHVGGHVMDHILSPSNSSFVSNVTVGDLVLAYAFILVKCHLDFACPVIPRVDSISYRIYHKINI